MKNIVLAVLSLLVLASCASFAPLDQIPVKNEDFKLPPETLLIQFPDVAAHHEDNVDQTRHDSNNTYKGSLEELTRKWGFPKKSTKEMSNALVFYGYTPLINAVIFWPYFEYIIPISAIEMIAMGPTKHVIWKKQNYVIDATFSGRSKSHLISWKWHYIDEQGKEVPLIREAIKRWFIGLSVSRGYEVLTNDVDPGQMKMGRGGEMTFGREFGGWKSIAFDTRMGFKVHGNGINATGQRLMYLRAHWDLGMRYHFTDSKFSSGLALVVEPVAAYKVNKRSYLATDIGYSFLKPAVGASFDVQYRRNSYSSVFMRAEYLKLKSKSSSESIDASNVAVGMRYYF